MDWLGWRRVFGPRGPAVDDARWVVLDVESSGLDPARDRLLAIAAVALHRDDGPWRIDLADSFEVVLEQRDAVPDRANILVHGIGVGEQRRGMPADSAQSGFEAFVARSPCLGWHAAFDRRLIERATAAALGRPAARAWLDLAELAPVLLPQVKAQGLDDWLAHFGIGVARRHQAAADTLAPAELLLRLWPAAAAEGARGFGDCVRIAARRRWIAAG
jgi:DNA polymerase-3 subunit epsilon